MPSDDDKIPTTMNAIALPRFGGEETLEYQRIPVPTMDEGEVLIRVHVAAVGEWDPFEREGGYKEAMPTEPTFPYILGSEGAGVIEAVGAKVTGLKVGDRVYTASFLNPKGGFYAEYAVVDAGLVSPIPEGMPMEQAGAVAGSGTTALRGLEDTLHIQAGESVLVFGAGGGVGHLAVQIAKRMGARVLAVASGADGLALAERLGADVAVDGHSDKVVETIREFAPDGLDVAFLTAGAEVVDEILGTMRKGGRVAYPNGIEPEPQKRDDLEVTGYNGLPDADLIARFHALMGDTPFEVDVAQSFALTDAADAQAALDDHYLGKLILRLI